MRMDLRSRIRSDLRGDVVGLERRLRHEPLALPRVAFVEQQAGAE